MDLHLSLAALALAAIQAIPACAEDHPFAVADDIAMIRFNDQLNAPGSTGRKINVSPDGMHFAILTSRGNLETDKIETTLYVFDKSAIVAFLGGVATQPPEPRKLATIISFPHREEPEPYAPVIQDLRWSPDSKHIYFKGETATGNYQLFVADVDTGGFRSLTQKDESVGRYDVADGLIVYTASQKSVSTQVDSINPDAQVLTGHSLVDTLFHERSSTTDPETFGLTVMRLVHGNWKTTSLPQYSVAEIPYMSFLFPFSLSPEGDRLIGMVPVDVIPDSWERYDPATGFEHLRLKAGDYRSTNSRLIQRLQEYTLIDLHTGSMEPLIRAPNARVLAYTDPNLLVWAADERRVLVTNTFLPTDKRTHDGVETNAQPCAVASVDLPSFATRCLFFENKTGQQDTQSLQSIAFGANSDDVIVRIRTAPDRSAARHYQLRNGEWNLVAPAIGISPGPQNSNMDLSVLLSIRQNLNDPPTLWASKNKQSRQIWDPNPQLRHIRYGQASVYRWKDSTGYEWSGVLVKPVDYISGRKYPAVLQMYSVADGEFITDGLYPTAFAARELASAGFFVLQIKKKPTQLTEADAADSLTGYQSAVQSLSDAGFIDRHKVGVVGFSWTCWYVANALVKDPALFAAATIADGLDNGYMQYILFAAGAEDIRRQMDAIRGSPPFGNGLLGWIRDAPEFQLDRVKTPVRIEAIGPFSVLQEWELYSSLEMQGKPVDLIYFPHGTHIHQKPLERLESQQGNVDWLRFWLEDYEDPAPAKQREYERWRIMKNDQFHKEAN